MERRAQLRAILVGTVCQFALVLLSHFYPWVEINVFEFGGMMISATAAYLYAQEIGAGYGRMALGGALVGAVCALMGITLAVSLHDKPPVLLLAGTLIAALTGLFGGLFGQMSHNWIALVTGRNKDDGNRD